jgi:hypothetical protein
MRIESIRQITNRRPDKTPLDESQQGPVNQDLEAGDFGAQDFEIPAEASRALVLTTPQPEAARPRSYRQATFLAQLIATRELAPQTRERRRAEPGEASAAYRTMAALGGV